MWNLIGVLPEDIGTVSCPAGALWNFCPTTTERYVSYRKRLVIDAAVDKAPPKRAMPALAMFAFAMRIIVGRMDVPPPPIYAPGWGRSFSLNRRARSAASSPCASLRLGSLGRGSLAMVDSLVWYHSPIALESSLICLRLRLVVGQTRSKPRTVIPKPARYRRTTIVSTNPMIARLGGGLS